MKIKRATKIAISLVYFGLVTLVRGGLRLLGRSCDARLVVLYYHGVPVELRRNFERQMDALSRRASVVPATFRGHLPPGKKYVAITFDDALGSLFDNALPGLASRSFHATIFVPVGWIGRHPTWAADEDCLNPDDAVMTIEQLKKLDSHLVSLGGHTISHPLLSKLDARQLRDEVEGSRNRLAELSGQDIRSFSFPYGDHDANSVEACKAAGYDVAFSILPEEVNTMSSRFLRGRTSVDPSDGPLEFFLKFNGGYVWASQMAPVIRKLRFAVSSKSDRCLHDAESKPTSRWIKSDV